MFIHLICEYETFRFHLTGSSWKPIGKRGKDAKDTKKRTSWFTDIPYLRNPFLSYPRLKNGAGKAHICIQ